MQHPGAREAREHLSGWYQHDHAVANWLKPFLHHWLGEDQRTNLPYGDKGQMK
jgi:hypothetical protein